MSAGIKLRERPEHCPGDYCLHLYCRYENLAHEYREFPHHVTDCETGAEARRYARQRGWILHRDRTATCPKCAQALRASLSPSTVEAGR